MVDLGQIEHPVAPGVDRAGPVAVLVHQPDLLEDLPVVVMGLEGHGVLIDLADLTDGGGSRQVAAAAPQLVAAEPGLHGALGPEARLLLEEPKVVLGPPGEAIALVALPRVGMDLDAQDHVDAQHLVVLGEEVGAA